MNLKIYEKNLLFEMVIMRTLRTRRLQRYCNAQKCLNKFQSQLDNLLNV